MKGVSDHFSPRRSTAPFKASAAYLVLTLALGGAGENYPLADLAVEAGGLALLTFFAWRRDVEVTRWAAALIALAVLVPLISLFPLPPGLWSSLPGRSGTIEVLGLIGEPLGWRALTLDSEASWRSSLTLIPAVALFVATLNLSGAEHVRLAAITVAFAALTAVVSAAQVASAGEWAILETAHRAHGTGLFSNRNHQAAFLIVAMLLAGALARIGRSGPLRISRLVATVAILVLGAGVLATSSRAGALMLLMALPAALLGALIPKLGVRPVVLAVAGIVLVSAIAALSPAGELVQSRFGAASDDLRLRFWKDIPVAIATYWPWGSGLGTFPTVFQAFEQLDLVGPGFVNNAHNDYLELAVEGGLPVLLAMLAGLALLVAGGSNLVRSSNRRGKILASAAWAAVLLLLLHSIVDYPLRMLSLSGLFGMLAGMLFAQAGSPASRLRSFQAAAVLAAAVLLLVKAFTVHLASEAVLREHASLARALAPYSATAATFIAVDALKAGRAESVEQAALTALRQSPVRLEPLALLGLARQAAGSGTQARTIMNMVGARTWREPVANLWLLNDGLTNGNAQQAAQRGDALLRQGLFIDPVLAAFKQLAADPAGRTALAERLAAEPNWRGRLLTSSEGFDPAAHHALLLAVAKRGSRVSEEEAAAAVRGFVGDARPVEAYRAWRQLARTVGLVADPSFERLASRGENAPPVPFEWRFNPPLGSKVSAEEAERGDGFELRISSGVGIVGPVVEQTLVLSPGSYVLTAEIRQNSPGVRLIVECVRGRELKLRGDAQPAGTDGTVRSTFVVPAGCPTQSLKIALTGETATEFAGSISNLAINLAP